MICTTGKYYNHQVKNDDKSGTSGTHVKEETAHILQRPEDLEVGENIILKWFLNKQHGRVLSRLKWLNKKEFRSLVNAAMDFCVILNAENFH
jgi:hypothetical protein